jgi:hypothetical protein
MTAPSLPDKVAEALRNATDRPEIATSELIALRVDLQIYVERSDRLDRLAQLMPVVRAPTLVPQTR